LSFFSTHPLLQQCWIFTECEKNWILFMFRCFNCPSVNKDRQICHPRYLFILARSFWR
jgi:hypothetical protein